MWREKCWDLLSTYVPQSMPEFIQISIFNTHSEPCQVRKNFPPIFQMRELRIREVERPASSCRRKSTDLGVSQTDVTSHTLKLDLGTLSDPFGPVFSSVKWEHCYFSYLGDYED